MCVTRAPDTVPGAHHHCQIYQYTPHTLGFICFVSFVVVYHCSLFSSTVATEESLGLSSFPLQPCHANNYCNIGNFSHQRNDQNILRSSTTFPSGLRFERTETTRTSSCQGIVTPWNVGLSFGWFVGWRREFVGRRGNAIFFSFLSFVFQILFKLDGLL